MRPINELLVIPVQPISTSCTSFPKLEMVAIEISVSD